MKIDELDECQGLTADMVREWLTAQKATFRDGHWTHPNGKYRYKDGEYGGLLWSLTLSQIAADFDKPNEQALLREINPRMRKGMPSDAALAEHDEWIVCTPFGATFIAEISYGGSDDGFSIMMPPINDHCDAEFIAEKHWPECLFWPCDEHGNKVRWPVDAEGKML
jgi:hypothetical protein